MPKSLSPVKIKPREWVDLYAASSITAGTAITIQNTGRQRALVTESAESPSGEVGFNTIPIDEFISIGADNIGVWAYAYRGTSLQVEVS